MPERVYMLQPSPAAALILSDQFECVLARAFESKALGLALQLFTHRFHDVYVQRNACTRLHNELVRLAEQVARETHLESYTTGPDPRAGNAAAPPVHGSRDVRAGRVDRVDRPAEPDRRPHKRIQRRPARGRRAAPPGRSGPR